MDGVPELCVVWLQDDRVAERVFVGVEEDAGLVVVSCASVWLEGEDVGPDDMLDCEVGRVDGL